MEIIEGEEQLSKTLSSLFEDWIDQKSKIRVDKDFSRAIGVRNRWREFFNHGVNPYFASNLAWWKLKSVLNYTISLDSKLIHSFGRNYCYNCCSRHSRYILYNSWLHYSYPGTHICVIWYIDYHYNCMAIAFCEISLMIIKRIEFSWNALQVRFSWLQRYIVRLSRSFYRLLWLAKVTNSSSIFIWKKILNLAYFVNFLHAPYIARA
jgi:hypothetical protein